MIWVMGKRIVNTPSVEPVLKSRFLPRFSFRFLFLLTFICALVGAILQSAGAGYAVAISAVVSLSYFLVFFALCILLFLVLWSLSFLQRDKADEQNAGSPFAEGQLPPQILPPRNPTA
jgi:uncharacterized Tic20 family protein